MELAPAVAALPPDGTSFSVFVGREQIALPEADVLLLRAADPTLEATFEADPLFQGLPVVQRKDHIWTGEDLWSSFRSPSVLTIPYALEHLEPELEGIGLGG